MNRMEELLDKLSGQSVTSDELAELKQKLATSEGRAQARDILQMESALHSAFQATPVLEVQANRPHEEGRAQSTPFPETGKSLSVRWGRSWRRRQPWAAAAALALLCSIAWWHFHASRAGSGTLTFAAGVSGQSIFITRGDRTWSPSGSAEIGANDVIELAPGSASAELRFDNTRTILTLQPGAKFRVVSLIPQKRFVLDRGALRADVARQPNEAPLLIQTPTAEALVLGTIFSLAGGNEHTSLNVERGMVRLSQGDGSTENIKAGQSAVASLGAPVEFMSAPAGVMSIADHPAQKRVRGPLAWSASNEIVFFAGDKKLWNVPGATWESDGNLWLSPTMERPSPYGAVSPNFPVRPGERLVLSGRARTENGGQLRIRYYQRDAEMRCFGVDRIPGAFSVPDGAGFIPFEFEFQVLDSADLKFIALILYCYHADGGFPQEGDAVAVENLTIARR